MGKHELFPTVNRRDFIKTCVTVSAMLGLPFGMVSKVAAAAQKSDGRPAVIWLHFQECTGCSESLLRSSHPTVANLILDMISLDYHETLMAAAGHQAEASLAEGVHVGNFVELKKTSMGKRSKANHLSYLGDATIGAGVNVGCGTITCNYDGEHKHPTVIGDGVFVGSDSILVAPITIGKGAYVAAGSTLTESVPAGALALGRSRQVNKNGWARKRAAAKASGKGR